MTPLLPVKVAERQVRRYDDQAGYDGLAGGMQMCGNGSELDNCFVNVLGALTLRQHEALAKLRDDVAIGLARGLSARPDACDGGRPDVDVQGTA